MEDLSRLITSEFNEEKFLALAILIMQYQTAQDKEFLYNFYLNNIKHVNNWNLVDASAHHIIGAYLWDKEKDYLFTLTKSEILWERRIAIVATWYFIKNNTLNTTFEIAKLLLNDKHDLMYKAVGWMLREAGKKDAKQFIDFLDRYTLKMLRIAVRYAIERLPQAVYKKYLLKN
ncbi:DNA alkylation repair enzyme family protein [Rickettsia parkeri str. Tate's Hell]|uniref:DNA alkylation repair enzyme family protein n=1 Tax=Rickettsia parkeri str. Tate's Hell TaxID=1359189 RepID=A0ABR5DPX6_RICPA|nr:DNA alkylation repair protein [Rickettsia parkeri]KJV94409.1 DNA alkylation repair enzyme family protein [Rickettsia parkeri str. Grand Bay]KJV96376.1 DNA alkylation repair enzyme family protein [Rickettsia parkeri str. AT\